MQKEEWILIYGSDNLKYLTQLGYECQDLYLKERIHDEYLGFKLWDINKLEVLDAPSIVAAKQSLRWENAQVMKGICGLYLIPREVIVIHDYLGSYTLVRHAKKTTKALLYDVVFYFTILATFLTLDISMIFVLLRLAS